MFDDLQVEHSTTVDRVADGLRRALFAGDLPPETPLREVALAEATGVARSTVREALGVLTAEGLVVRIPNKGVLVRQLDAADIRDALVARRALESAGVRAYATSSPAARAALGAAFDTYVRVANRSTDAAEVSAAHLAVHRAIVGLAGSERLLAASDSIAGEIRLGLAHLDRVRGNVDEQVEVHRRLVELIATGTTEQALADLEAHLSDAEVSLVAALEHATIDV